MTYWTICALVSWLGLRAHVHAQWLSPGRLSAAHAQLDDDKHCASCHASGSRVAEPGCLRCHSAIEAQRSRSRGLHGTQFRGQTCVECHIEHLGRQVALIRWPGPDASQFDHTSTGWPLRGAHGPLECADCHRRKNERGNATYLGLDRRCGSCHEDPHAGRLGTQCRQCHDETSFRRLELSQFNHDLARFPLRGAHVALDCAKCHQEPGRYRGLAFSDCSSCHVDAHEGRMRAACKACHQPQGWSDLSMPRPLHPGLDIGGGHRPVRCDSCHDAGRARAPSAGRRCVDCHEPVHDAPFGEQCGKCHRGIRWVGLSDALGRSAHGLTEFPLLGAHRRVDCEGCHASDAPVSERYRHVEHQTCAACHADVHRGTLQKRGDCAACHRASGFAPSAIDWQRHADFGFALEGGHAATACSACHRHPDGQRTMWSTHDKRCADCHENPHGSQFTAEIASAGCAGCHTPHDWGVLAFEHTFWPLTGSHGLIGCTACHAATAGTPSAQPQAARAQFQGLPRSCEGCHDDVHAGQFRLSAPRRSCDECHTTEAFKLASFDHARVAGYRLEGQHQQAACAQCHPGVHLHNGEEVVRYRLGYNGCAACHADPHTEAKGTR